jgi:hypothetical protein
MSCIKFRYVFYPISSVFFAKCNLIRLRNTPTKFREAAPSRNGAMLKLDGNEVVSVSSAFFIRFLRFFLLNVI